MGIWRRDLVLGVLSGAALRAAAAASRPKLFVVVLAEQLRADALEDRDTRLGAGGLRKLMDGGAWFPDCRHLASSFTSTGIATLATGSWPSEHGIVGDAWYERGMKQTVRAGGASLLATTLAAQVVSAPRTRAYVVSLDGAHGALWAGSNSVKRFWMDADGRFITTGEVPGWLEEANRRVAAEKYRDAGWMAVGARAGAPPLRTLKFDASKPSEFMALYRASPFAEEAQFDFTADLIAREKLGQGDTLDFVCVLAGSSALLGLETGGTSPLMRQFTLKLDQHLEKLLATLAKTPGERNFGLALCAAHGAPPAPSDADRARVTVDGEALARTVDAALVAAGAGKVARYVYPFLHLDIKAGRDAEAVRVLAGRTAMQHPAVAGYYTAEGACTASDDWRRRFRNSFHAVRSGDVMLSYHPEFVESFAGGRGISYGSLYNYDERTPLIFYGPQFRAGVYEETVESVDVAPTLARAAGVAAPSSATGRVLSAAFGRIGE